MLNVRATSLFIFHLLLVCLFSHIYFITDSGHLFVGNDGPTVVATAREQLEFIGVSPDFHTNFLQGAGNLGWLYNFSVLPAFWVGMLDGKGVFAPSFTYLFFVVLWFTGVVLVGWNYGFSRTVRYGAAWLITVTGFPNITNLLIYPMTAACPHYVVLLFAVILADIGLKRMGEAGWRLEYAALFLLALLILLIQAPQSIILMMPFLAISGILALVFATGPERLRKCIILAVLLVLAGALGWVEYVLGLLLNTSTGFFLKEMAVTYPPQLHYASILYQGEYPDRSFGPYLFISAFLGAVLALHRRELRRPAIMLLLAQLLHGIIAGFIMLRPGGWSGPAPVYSEMAFFALYGLFAVYFVTYAIKRATALRAGPGWAYAFPLLFVVLFAGVYLLRLHSQERSLTSSFAMMPASTPITDILQREIGLKPGARFNGRVANIMKADLDAQFQYYYKGNALVRNDHDTTGLWLKNIPTLQEYSQITTPWMYRLNARFLTAPDIKQNRAMTFYSAVNLPLLRLLGVRFILSPEPVAGAKERAVLPLGEALPLRLFEIDGVNVAGVSATRVSISQSVKEAEDKLAGSNFKDTVILDAGRWPLPAFDALVPVAESSIAIEKGAYRIQAKSTGRSLLIVPIEFSNCLDLRAVSGAKPQAVRADVALTGLIFEREMDIRMVMKTGLLTNPRCRLKDYRDFAKLWR